MTVSLDVTTPAPIVIEVKSSGVVTVTQNTPTITLTPPTVVPVQITAGGMPGKDGQPGPMGTVPLVTLTQAEYDALPSIDPLVMYVITDGADRTILTGTRAPLPSDGINGDFWIDQSIWHISGPKAAGAWPAAVSMVGPTGAGLTQETADARYVNLDGDAMTGVLAVLTPTLGNHAATKDYADTKAPLTHSHAIGDLPTGTTGTTVALGNHAHAGVYDPAGTAASGDSTHEASATAHANLRGTATPVSSNTGASVVGTATKFSREDHKHQTLVDVPVALGAANAQGSSTNLSRSDHVHIYPTLAQLGAVSLTAAETIGGNKTFSSGVVIDTPGTAYIALDREAVSNYAQFEFRTTGTQAWTVGTGPSDETFKISNTGSGTALSLSKTTNEVTLYKQMMLTAPVAGYATLRMPHGTAPSAPVNGDVWTTSAGIFVRINGTTVGPLGDPAAAILTHEGKADPHGIYLTLAEGNASYSPLGHTHPSESDYQFVYDSPATMADPGAGKVRTNTDVGTPSTQIAFNDITFLGVDVSSMFSSLTIGDGIYFQQLDNASNWGRFEINGAPVDNGSWWMIPVIGTEQHGTITKNTTVMCRFTYGIGGGGSGGNGLDQATADTLYVSRAGDTMAGTLTAPMFSSDTASGTEAIMSFRTSGTRRWTMGKTPTTESGGNAGSHFSIARWSDAGAWIDNPISIDRASGAVTITKSLWLADPVPAQGNNAASRQYVDARTPQIVVGTTAPTDLTAIWVDTN